MDVTVVTPELPEARAGNWITAARYRRILEGLGHRVRLTTAYDGAASDALIALHARRSHPSIRRFADERPNAPLIVVLTGTDLYRDIRTDRDAQASLDLAQRLVVLQRMGLGELGEEHRAKARVIYQSVSACRANGAHPPSTYFRVAVVGHLRPEKDPMRVALAARRLPPRSRIRITHVGGVLDPELGRQAQEENARGGRYRWVGGVPHWRV
ncbi:MAG TPA: hypothetical protein VFC51_16610 [Chloroflexota bacterium]|nr:hypothetical protein [Chloroflexota bacterium]